MHDTNRDRASDESCPGDATVLITEMIWRFGCNSNATRSNS